MSANGTTAEIVSECSCRGCGAIAPIAEARVTGTWSVTAERTEWACPHCTRDQLQEIEAGLTRIR